VGSVRPNSLSDRNSEYLADDVVEDPAAAGDRDEGERHVDGGAEQVGNGQVAQEQVGSRSHAAISQDDDDDERVADDRGAHDRREAERQTGAPRRRPVRRRRRKRGVGRGEQRQGRRVDDVARRERHRRRRFRRVRHRRSIVSVARTSTVDFRKRDSPWFRTAETVTNKRRSSCAIYGDRIGKKNNVKQYERQLYKQ